MISLANTIAYKLDVRLTVIFKGSARTTLLSSDRQTDVNHYRPVFQNGACAQTLILTTDLLDIRPKGTVVSYLSYLQAQCCNTICVANCTV